MSSELRKRASTAGSSSSLSSVDGGDCDGDGESRDFTPLLMQARDKARPPAAFDLLSMNPAKTGYADKKSNSCLPSICPCWFPLFKKRFFILIGNFLYRYSSENGERPKGVPIPLDAVTVSAEDTITFKLKMIRKDYVIRCETAAECQAWIKAINNRKYSSIREDMGHAPLDPAVKELNDKASAMFFDRLDREQEESLKTLKSLGGGVGGPLPNFSMGGMGGMGGGGDH